MLRYVAIDPATSTGWASFSQLPPTDGDETAAARFELVAHGHFRVRTSAATAHGDWCLDMERQIGGLLDALVEGGAAIAHAFVEDYFFSSRACNGVTINVKFRAVIEMCLRRRGIEYTLVHPARWFAAVVGPVARRTPTSERKQRTVRALEAAYGIVVPSRDGRRQTPSDVYDAIAIGVHGIAQRHPRASFSPSCRARDGVPVERGDDRVVAA